MGRSSSLLLQLLCLVLDSLLGSQPLRSASTAREKADDSSFLPNPTHMPAPREARAVKRDGRSVSCHNCDDRNGHPRHRPTKCPFRRFDGYQWDAPHEPVAKL